MEDRAQIEIWDLGCIGFSVQEQVPQKLRGAGRQSQSLNYGRCHTLGAWRPGLLCRSYTTDALHLFHYERILLSSIFFSLIWFNFLQLKEDSPVYITLSALLWPQNKTDGLRTIIPHEHLTFGIQEVSRRWHRHVWSNLPNKTAWLANIFGRWPMRSFLMTEVVYPTLSIKLCRRWDIARGRGET